jgi:hypothetical protein
MSNRNTSKEAYDEISDNGLLSKRRFQVYHILYNFGPMTAGEIFQKGLEFDFWGINAKATICTRCGELKDRQVATIIGTRKDQYSKFNNWIWDVTDGLPVSPPKKVSSKTKINKLKSAIKFLMPKVNKQSQDQVKLILQGKQIGEK